MRQTWRAAAQQRDGKAAVTAPARHLQRQALRLFAGQAVADEGIEIGNEALRHIVAEGDAIRVLARQAEQVGAHQVHLQDGAVARENKIANRGQQVEIVEVVLVAGQLQVAAGALQAVVDGWRSASHGSQHCFAGQECIEPCQSGDGGPGGGPLLRLPGMLVFIHIGSSLACPCDNVEQLTLAVRAVQALFGKALQLLESQAEDPVNDSCREIERQGAEGGGNHFLRR